MWLFRLSSVITLAKKKVFGKGEETVQVEVTQDTATETVLGPEGLKDWEPRARKGIEDTRRGGGGGEED